MHIVFLEKEIKLDDIPILDTGDNPIAPEPREIIDLETNLEGIEEDLKEINNNFEQLKKNFFELVELNYLLQKTKVFFEGVCFYRLLYPLIPIDCYR